MRNLVEERVEADISARSGFVIFLLSLPPTRRNPSFRSNLYIDDLKVLGMCRKKVTEWQNELAKPICRKDFVLL
jgi:hypothetical protein